MGGLEQGKARRQVFPFPSSTNFIRFFREVSSQRNKNAAVDENRRQPHGSQAEKEKMSHYYLAQAVELTIPVEPFAIETPPVQLVVEELDPVQNGQLPLP